MKTCPQCGVDADPAARECPVCGYDFTPGRYAVGCAILIAALALAAVLAGF